MPALSKEQRKYLERATLQYAGSLDVAAGWLEARGIELEHARSNGLGVVTNPLPGHEHLDGYLAIPYLTDRGPVNISFRCIKNHDCKEIPHHSKMGKKKGSGTNLYGVQALAWADEWCVVCEGELDALVYQQIGVPAVGVPGAENWKPYWDNIFEDFSRVYLAEDGDTAGKDLWERMTENLSNVIRMKMPDGEDVNSMYLKSGKDYLLGRIRK